MRIETKDLVLAKAKIEDLEDIFNNYWRHEETAKYMLWKVCKTIEEAEVKLKKCFEFQKKHAIYFVYEKASGKAIGSAGMIEMSPKVFQDCGIGIGIEFVGKGYGKQILNALLGYCFNKKQAEKVVCSCISENIPSAKMQQSCGLKYTHSETITREKDGLDYLFDYYEITKEEYFSKKN